MCALITSTAGVSSKRRRRSRLRFPMTRRRGLQCAGAASLVVVASALAACGGSNSEPSRPAKLSQRALLAKAAQATVSVHNHSHGQTIHGSGVVYDADRGLILTAASVIWQRDSVEVALHDGRKLPARLVARSPCADIAVLVLQPPPAGLVALPLGSSSDLQAGDPVTAAYVTPIGGDRHTELQPKEAHRFTATHGTVAASDVSVSFSRSLPDFKSVVEHQAPLTATAAGGPLLNSKGQIVAINTLLNQYDKHSPAAMANLSYGISSDYTKRRLSHLKPRRTSFYRGWATEHQCHQPFEHLVMAYRGLPGAAHGGAMHEHH
jgi:S1-C subfamily serine protease